MALPVYYTKYNVLFAPTHRILHPNLYKIDIMLFKHD